MQLLPKLQLVILDSDDPQLREEIIIRPSGSTGARPAVAVWYDGTLDATRAGLLTVRPGRLLASTQTPNTALYRIAGTSGSTYGIGYYDPTTDTSYTVLAAPERFAEVQVSWGDGSAVESFTAPFPIAQAHTYPAPGEYQITTTLLLDPAYAGGVLGGNPATVTSYSAS